MDLGVINVPLHIIVWSQNCRCSTYSSCSMRFLVARQSFVSRKLVRKLRPMSHQMMGMLIYIQSVLLLKQWPKGEIWRQTILQMQLDSNDNSFPIAMIIKQARNHNILEQLSRIHHCLHKLAMMISLIYHWNKNMTSSAESSNWLNNIKTLVSLNLVKYLELYHQKMSSKSDNAFIWKMSSLCENGNYLRLPLMTCGVLYTRK